MHILVLTDRFTPEVTAVSVRTHAHAKVWLEHGHEVTVVTSVPNFPKGRVFEGYTNKLYQEEFVDGIRVVRLGTYMAANEGMFKRTLDYLSFTLSAILQCGRFPVYDVLIATSPPIFVPMAGSVIGFLKRRPWVFEVRDLWPASIAAVGVTKSPLLRLVEKYELHLYRRAARVIVLTHSFKADLTRRGIDANKISVVTNGIEVAAFRRPGNRSAVRQQLGVSDRDFLLGYIGTTGMAHGLETVLEAAGLCREDSDIKFLIMGEGATRSILESIAKEMALENVIFRDFVPHYEVASYLSALDMCIVHLKPDPVFKTVIPSKIFEAMALGVPIIHAVEGESAQIVANAGAGVCVPSGDAQAIADQARKFYDDRAALIAMGDAGRKTAIEKYDRSRLAMEALHTLQRIVRPRQSKC